MTLMAVSQDMVKEQTTPIQELQSVVLQKEQEHKSGKWNKRLGTRSVVTPTS